MFEAHDCLMCISEGTTISNLKRNRVNKDHYFKTNMIMPTKIVAIIGKENEYGKIEILGIGKSKSLGVHRGVVNNITQTIESIQQAVQQA